MSYLQAPPAQYFAPESGWPQALAPIEASPAMWTEFSAPTIAPAALHHHPASPMTAAPYETDLAIAGEYLCLPVIEAPKIVVTAEHGGRQHPASSPSSPEGTPTHLSPRSSWSGASSPIPAPLPPSAQHSVPSPPQHSSGAASSAAMDALMQLIAWPAGGARSAAAKKRPRSEHEYTKDKHLLTEKRRREDMSEAIDSIHRIMPESRMDKKVTKVDILQDAALYFAKLQAVALALVEENAQLRARCQQRASNGN